MLCPRCQAEYRDGFRRCADCEVDLVDDAADPMSLRCSSCGAEYIEGTSICADCMGTDLRPIRPAWVLPEHPSRWRATEGLRTALVWLLLTVAIATLAEAFAHLHRVHVIDRITKQTATLGEVQHADALVGAATLAEVTLMIAAAVVFILWQRRTAKNAEALGRAGARYGPGWSIGGWFVPFGNLWIPVRVMQDLWRSSDPASSPENWRSRPGSALVGWWWAAFIVAGLASRANGARVASTLSDLLSADESATVEAVMFIIAAVLAIHVVRSLTERQVALRASLSDASVSTGWYPDPEGRFEYRYWDGRTWTNQVRVAGQPQTDPLPASSATRDGPRV